MIAVGPAGGERYLARQRLERGERPLDGGEIDLALARRHQGSDLPRRVGKLGRGGDEQRLELGERRRGARGLEGLAQRDPVEREPGRGAEQDEQAGVGWTRPTRAGAYGIERLVSDIEPRVEGGLRRGRRRWRRRDGERLAGHRRRRRRREASDRRWGRAERCDFGRQEGG